MHSPTLKDFLKLAAQPPQNHENKINRKNMRNKIIGLLGLALAGLFLTGCATNSAVTRVNKPDRSLVVVPVKGQPIILRNIHTSAVVGFGLVGGLIEKTAATSSSETLCARLNQDTNFNGERILAEECAKLLKSSPKVAFHDVVVHPIDSAMPRIKDMESSEQQRFKVNCTYIFKWNENFSDWRKSPPVGSSLPTSRRAVFLEVTFLQVILNHQNMLQPATIYVRLIDSETGEALGYGYSSQTFDITEVTQNCDLQAFESDFRKCMNESARKVLHDLNLL
jgi:hypothetical protein